MKLMIEEYCEQSQAIHTLYVNQALIIFHIVTCQITKYTAIKTITVRSEQLHLNNRVQLKANTPHLLNES